MKSQLTKIFYLIIIVFTSCNKENQIVDNQVVGNSNLNLNKWTKRANIPNEYLRLDADVITYNNEAYLLPGKGGTRFSSKPEILKYSEHRWTQVATYGGFAVAGNSATIRNDDVIYILGGVNGSSAPTEEVRAYSITTNTSSNESRFPKADNATYNQTKAYFGNNETFSSYDFISETGELLPVIPSNEPISSALLCSENNIIYALFDFLANDNFFAFNEDSKTWVSLPDFPGEKRSEALMTSTRTDIYVGLGYNQGLLNDIWKYNIETSEWMKFMQYPGTAFSGGFSFELDNELFFGGGYTGGGSISNEVLNEEIYSIKVK